MSLVPNIRDGDWTGVRKAIQQISSTKLGPISTPTFTGLALTGLTASRLIATNASKVLVSSDLASWVTGVANEIDITDDADGTITIGIVDPLIVAKGGTGLATITNHGILLGSGTGAVTPLAAATNGQIPIGSTGADPVLAGLTGTANQVTVTNGAGTITLSLPQNIHTGASPAFSTLELSGSLSIKQADFAKYGIIYFIGSEFASNRELTIDLNDGNRIIDLPSAHVTLGDWFNQEVKNTSSPTFANITVSTNINGLNLTSITPGNWSIGDGTKLLTVTENCNLNQDVGSGTAPTFGIITVSSIITGGDIGVSGDTDLLQLAANALTVNGTVSGVTGSTFGNLTLADGSITDSGGAISFGNENLSTTGTLGVGATITLTNVSGDTTLQFIDTLANDNAFQILHDTSADSLIISSYFSSAWFSAFEIEARGDVVINKGGFQGAGKIVQNMKAGSGDGITDIFSSGINLGNGVGQVGDGLGYLFRIENAGGVQHDAAKWIIKWDDPTAGSEDTATVFQNMVAGSFVDALVLQGDIVVLPKASGKGIKIDTTTPTFGWRDLLGQIRTRGVGANDPGDAIYIGNIKAYQFAVNDECWVDYHIPHDYVPGTDIFLHFHWGHIGTLVTGGTVTWGADITYAKGHNQAAFPATVNTTIVGNASTTQYQHIITEVQISTSGGAAGQIDTDDLEPDGVIMIRGYLSANNITVSSGGVPDPFLHFKDIHYQSTNIATKNKAPNFYT